MSAADLGPELREGAGGSAELLTAGADGRAVEGVRIPGTYAVARCLADGDRDALAYLHTFFRRDEQGQVLPGTWVNFFVPDRLLVGGRPTGECLRLVAERMGWE